ncbi:metal-dependent hydrolase [Paenibacillus sp. y28]|uniref:metal-dependent hydrolase n=1 Tax=Paenibacillus sp. y28 TaxID=3129110 RepID=UPI0030185B0C
MDTITHTLFGLTLYGACNKTGMTAREKRALLLTTVAGSQIPDMDVISQWWDTMGRYQMWHRGLTHSVFLVPVWAALLALLTRVLYGVRGWKWFWIPCLAVFIHDTSDLFNAWGTGYFEPFSSKRVAFGTIPIVDVVFWVLMLGGFLLARFRPNTWQPHRIYRGVWIAMLLHVSVQSGQGYLLYEQASEHYDQVALSAGFVPGQFSVIGKKDGVVTISESVLLREPRLVVEVESQEGADMDRLFALNPKAQTLYEWSPFVVKVDETERLGIYDPRLYRNGQFFLSEYANK